MSQLFRQLIHENQYTEVDYDILKQYLPNEQVEEMEIFSYLKVQLPKSGKFFLKKRSWVMRYCCLHKSEIVISKNEKYDAYERGSFVIHLQDAVSMKVYQSVERMNKSMKKQKQQNLPPRYVEIIDEHKKKFRLSFLSDDEMNYWLSALFRIFKKVSYCIYCFCSKYSNSTFSPLLFLVKRTHDEVLIAAEVENAVKKSNLDDNSVIRCEPQFSIDSKLSLVPFCRNKMKHLTSALDDEKKTQENEECKKLMDVRANMLKDRRTELLRLLQEETIFDTCKSLITEIVSKADSEPCVVSLSSSDETPPASKLSLSSDLCTAKSLDGKSDANEIEEIKHHLSTIEETNVESSRNDSTVVTFAKGDKRSSFSSEIFIQPRRQSEFMKKMHDLYEKKMVFPKHWTSNLECKVRGTVQFPISTIRFNGKTVQTSQPAEAPVLRSVVCLGDHEKGKCIPNIHCKLCSRAR